MTTRKPGIKRTKIARDLATSLKAAPKIVPIDKKPLSWYERFGNWIARKWLFRTGHGS